jgi:hypothetical protein
MDMLGMLTAGLSMLNAQASQQVGFLHVLGRFKLFLIFYISKYTS